ncbi:UDP-N-acetylglucosamine 2-epimerase (hydrolyzing) [Jiangella aurantiaca]|uniref:UDP-N-acetylglucosamine 2-epimerase (Hydrolyzing) n=1 Tax=Jiangella aurantiaca TaxID=2530373 RepID=A0A4R5AE27_9ACTN|nr:UDP-N-acetylglucosamine 2-epimerase [Jiangella aurantiaca]TDD70733.1 UDP-N-acetylglucosamine 2-epimerase (hydrolyzing) [Jiangella aurantiaca]
MRRICVFTGSRADYGPLLPLIRALDRDPEVDLRLLASGGHLLRAQGSTVEQIEADGFRVDERVDIVLASDTPTAVAKSLGLGLIGYADALDRLRPDLLVVLGDRYEALAVTVAAALRLLPVAHIGGGELSYGSTDDSVRHAITKFAQLHFTSNEEFRQRVIQMGEDPSQVHAFGAPGLDTVRTMSFLSRVELADVLRVKLSDPLFVVTYHPATADPRGSRDGIVGLLEALDEFPEATVVFTGTNVDQGGSGVYAPIERYVVDNPHRSTTMPSLGQAVYLSLVKQASVVVGNSSSALVEAPALHTPTVNIGSRQDGRPRAASVIDCGESSRDIAAAIRQALGPAHLARTARSQSPFGDGRAADRISAFLRETAIGEPLIGAGAPR